MRILLVNDTLYPDSIGGVEKRNHDLARALAARGHEVTLAGFGAIPAELPPNISVVSFGPLGSLYRNGRRSRLHAFRYARCAFGLDVARFDVVETANIPYIHVVALALRCALAGKPLLVSWYEFWGAYWREYMGGLSAPLYRLAEWLTAQLGDAVLASSGLTAARLAARRRRSDSVPVVGCGIDLEAVSPALGEPVAPGATLLYAGRLIKQKRIDLLLGALALLPRESGASLAIYGEGPERRALESLALHLGVADRVAFHGHVEGSAELWRRIRSARIAVQPSAREGFGIFPLEAMALGVPVVYCLSADSAVGELVRDGVEGLASEPDRDALARAIGRLLSDDTLRTQLGAAGRLRAREFALDRIGERMDGLLSMVRRSRVLS
ncbi:MAG: glycosyltransferase family 4 protein [Thermoanaerobaculia bacterium]|jgi:glycosyltransferase involved in cell wall biosynthesis